MDWFYPVFKKTILTGQSVKMTTHIDW